MGAAFRAELCGRLSLYRADRIEWSPANVPRTYGNIEADRTREPTYAGFYSLEFRVQTEHIQRFGRKRKVKR